ncbi:ATP-dependent DNA ligase [Paenibacillus chitinolyticus]|uniref:ATP-dependent DNA ligase n=1 Tax=Paenibacillus chitinolyticus TaxID=79263 RepID=UPI00367223B1
MLLQTANEPNEEPSYLNELKFDGFRMIISNIDGVKLYTRHNNEVTSIFSELLDCPLPEGTIIDGEVVIIDAQGKPDFEALSKRFKSKTDKTLVTFFAFDIIRYRGIDTSGLPLLKRKELLSESFSETESYKQVKWSLGSASALYELVKANALEGLVQKMAESRYEIGKRSWNWQKVINWTYAEVFITGYKKNEFGWLTSVIDETGKMRATGVIELGVNPEAKKAFNAVKRTIAHKEDKNIVYLEPLIKANVKTRNWTKKGLLRSPVFVDYVL